MAEVNIDVAKQATSEEINSKLGLTNDEVTVGTVHSKLNSLVKNNADKSDMKSLSSEIKELINGNPTAFGNGVLGEVIYSEDFIYPSKDYYGRYILQFTNFTLPDGVVMTPPEKCNGLYIYCTGTCTINGTIDMRGKRLTLNSDNGISNFITIRGVNYPLAIGGHTVKGGNGGNGGKITLGNWTSGDGVDTGAPSTYQYYSGGVATNPTAGNINGGGSNNFGYKGNSDGSVVGSGSKGSVSGLLASSGAVIIVSHNLEVSSTGVINCEANEGIACENIGTNGTDANVTIGTGSSLTRTGTAGVGGNGAKAPSGGGCITIITNSLTNNGKLLTCGKSLSCIGSAVGLNSTDLDYYSDDGTNYHYDIHVAGGTAGSGGTFISQAGQIIVHVISA